MATILPDISRTFSEFLLVPGLTCKQHTVGNVNLKSALQKFKLSGSKITEQGLLEKISEVKHLNIPFTSSAMQSVSGSSLAIALARKGGAAFIFCSQGIEEQAEMVRTVKNHKAGFVQSDSNLPPSATLADVLELRKTTGHTTVAITDLGKSNGKFFGLLTNRDYWEFKDSPQAPVTQFYVPKEKLIVAESGISLTAANEIMWKNKLDVLPLLDDNGCLQNLVFRKDYYDHKDNPLELLDSNKRLFVAGALNTFDYQQRAPALIDAGVDCVCLDSSDGYSEWQMEAATWIRKQYGTKIVIGGGNVVNASGFRYLVEQADVDFVKIGIGGGSICITREQKGIGRGQASAVMEIAAERDKYFKETGIYVPICSDGGLNSDTQIVMALALGADFVMMGKYFAMTTESPTPIINQQGRLYKPYWGEGANRARNWQRYKQSEKSELVFEEGVDAYVSYAGSLSDRVDVSLAKIKSSFCNCGVLSIPEFHKKAVVTQVSQMTLLEGGTSTVEKFDK